MGCMVINTLMLQNADLPLAGIIFGSPYFEISEAAGIDSIKKIALKALKPLLEVFVVAGPIKVNRVSQSTAYTRKIMTQKKALPLLNVKGLISMLESIDNMQKYAPRFAYPFLMMQGELDDVVSNKGALKWYQNVSDKV